MKCVRLVRLKLENLPADLFGCFQAAGPLVLDRQGECFRNGCHKLDDARKPAHRNSLRALIVSRGQNYGYVWLTAVGTDRSSETRPETA